MGYGRIPPADLDTYFFILPQPMHDVQHSTNVMIMRIFRITAKQAICEGFERIEGTITADMSEFYQKFGAETLQMGLCHTGKGVSMGDGIILYRD